MIRLYIEESLAPGAQVALDDARAHYLRHVMRCKEGDIIAVFNGEYGEWEAGVRAQGKRGAALWVTRKLGDPRPCPDIWLAFAAIKNKNELVVEKATELGVRGIHLVITQHSVVKSANAEKLTAHAIEAAEQCERRDVPTLTVHKDLAAFLGAFPKERLLLYGDESGSGKPLPELAPPTVGGRGICILIGPEGGFSAAEHRLLQSAGAQGFGMGPRILRADTAAVAALACAMAALGDWHEPPHFKGAA